MTEYRATEKDVCKDYVTMRIGGQLFGIDVLTVQDVLGPQHITPIPLTKPEISGALNLRGRIVTVINLCERLGMHTEVPQEDSMSVVFEYEGHLYSLLVDAVGEVLSLPEHRFEKNPANINDRWLEVSSGIYRLKDELLVVLDISDLFQTKGLAA